MGSFFDETSLFVETYLRAINMSAYSKWAGLGGGANYLSRESQLVRSPTFPSPHLLLRGNWLHNSITVLLQSSRLFVAGVFQFGNR